VLVMSIQDSKTPLVLEDTMFRKLLLNEDFSMGFVTSGAKNVSAVWAVSDAHLVVV
jgi:hypothetical protein